MPSDWHYTALLDTVLARLPHSGELDEQSILELAAVLDNDLLGALNLIDHGQGTFASSLIRMRALWTGGWGEKAHPNVFPLMPSSFRTSAL